MDFSAKSKTLICKNIVKVSPERQGWAEGGRERENILCLEEEKGQGKSGK